MFRQSPKGGPVEAAKVRTCWLILGSMTSFELKPRFLTEAKLSVSPHVTDVEAVPA